MRSTSSHSQQRLFRGEVLSLTQENAQANLFAFTVEKKQGLIPDAEVLPGISVQENTLNNDRLNEILQEYLEEHKVRQEDDDG